MHTGGWRETALVLFQGYPQSTWQHVILMSCHQVPPLSLKWGTSWPCALVQPQARAWEGTGRMLLAQWMGGRGVFQYPGEGTGRSMKNLTTASLMHCGVLRPGFWSLQGTTPGRSLHPFKPVFLICQVGAIMLPLDTGRPYWIVDKDLICFLVSLFVFKLNLPLHLQGCWGHLQTYWTHFWVTLLSPLG